MFRADEKIKHVYCDSLLFRIVAMNDGAHVIVHNFKSVENDDWVIHKPILIPLSNIVDVCCFNEHFLILTKNEEKTAQDRRIVRTQVYHGEVAEVEDADAPMALIPQPGQPNATKLELKKIHGPIQFNAGDLQSDDMQVEMISMSSYNCLAIISRKTQSDQE